MNIGILTRNPEAWCSAQLRKAISSAGSKAKCFWFYDLMSRISTGPIVNYEKLPDIVNNLSSLIVRPIGRGSLDEVFFRVNTLHRLNDGGLFVINPPSAIERSVDKYYTMSLLSDKGIKVPKTIVTENPDLALEAFKELGSDVVIKPVFGSRGMGVTRVTDYEVVTRILHNLHYHHLVLYLQQYIPHGDRDIRAFVVGNEVVAAMFRISKSWKTNVSQGAKPISAKLSSEQEELAIKAASSIGCLVAGVDIIQSNDGHYVNEINSQPGFKGLQSVSKINIAEKIVKYVISSINKGSLPTNSNL